MSADAAASVFPEGRGGGADGAAGRDGGRGGGGAARGAAEPRTAAHPGATAADAGAADDAASDGSEPDYGYLAAADGGADRSVGSSASPPSSPDYERLGLPCDEEWGALAGAGPAPLREAVGEDEENDTEVGEEERGEEYILGTLAVRVLQATRLKPGPRARGGGGIAGLLTHHRRFRQQRHAPSLDSGGALTPASFHAPHPRHLYARLSYGTQRRATAAAPEARAHGEHHWSRGEQSYFDVTRPALPVRTGREGRPRPPPPALDKSAAGDAAGSAPAAAAPPHASAAGDEPGGGRRPPQSAASRGRPTPPLLRLAFYSAEADAGTSHEKEKNEEYLVGRCSIDLRRILSGTTPYFDEWCPLHRDDGREHDRARRPAGDDAEAAGRVRVVIEYEPADPPPRPGDTCVFADVLPLAEELYPIPLRSAGASSPTLRPKSYRVEEVVGDHVVLSYETPREHWHCTFEVHRYLLLCIERRQALAEQCRDRVLDLCDNLARSPALDAVARTVEALPDEGLVHVGAAAVGGGVGLVGRWWDAGLAGLVEDVVDGINWDGRHTRPAEGAGAGGEEERPRAGRRAPAAAAPDDGRALPGMPCCPITNVPMLEPVVAADGHTYERQAMARWLRTSERSPLTGEVLAHANLVPNYLLLSSLGNEVVVVAEPGKDGRGCDPV